MSDEAQDRLMSKRAGIFEALHEIERGPHPQGQRRGGLLVEQVMTRQPHSVRPGDSALVMVRLLREHHFRHLLVTEDGGRLLGVVSDRDLGRCFGPLGNPRPEQLERITAEQLMSTDLVTVEPTTSLEQAVVMLLGHGISSLPVLEHDRLVGILTNTDLYAVLQVLLHGLGRPAPAAAVPAASMTAAMSIDG